MPSPICANGTASISPADGTIHSTFVAMGGKKKQGVDGDGD